MTDFDFSDCEFIENEMKFYTFTDFCRNRYALKRLYRLLSRNGRIFYKYYVYANTHMATNFKNRIWDYLNDYIEDAELLAIEKMYRPS